jgi:hypothetical protein
MSVPFQILSFESTQGVPPHPQSQALMVAGLPGLIPVDIGDMPWGLLLPALSPARGPGLLLGGPGYVFKSS